MGYAHIENLYKSATILSFRECFALEKVHGTSAHVMWRDNGIISFASGGEKHERFRALFSEDLRSRFTALGHEAVTVYGEAYGGSQQGMSDTYGKALHFIAFEVMIGEAWLNVENAADVCSKLGIEFVPFARGPATVEWLNEQRDRDSEVAVRRGVGPGKKREGVVVRPVEEFRDHRGNRVIAKHKRDDFRETRTPREVNPEKLKVLADAEAIALEWVTDMRLEHVLQKIEQPHTLEKMGDVLRAMVEDVEREGSGEIIASPAARKAISAAASKLYKKRVSQI